MPIIKSAKKRMKQNAVRKARNFPVRSELKTSIKKILQMIKDGKAEEAKKFQSYAYSIIDTACKKKIIHSNNAARKKSRIARELNELEKKGETPSTPVKEEKKAAKSAPKAEKEVKEETKEEAK